MAHSSKPTSEITILPRLRIISGKDIALGPGKAELLSLIKKTCSIRDAAAGLGMSYMRAWMLVRTMNQSFKEPLVVTARGGRTGGGARLTPTGLKALALYQELEADCLDVCRKRWPELRKLLRK